MFPIILDIKKVKIAVLGNGPATKRRMELLEDAGDIYQKITSPNFDGFDVAFIADYSDEESEKYYKLAKRAGCLVNVEDKIAFCDFHVPAIVRRGDLLLTVSTGGKSPGMARAVRKKISEDFGEEWGERLERVARKRLKWKAQGLGFEKLSKLSKAMFNAKGWFKK